MRLKCGELAIIAYLRSLHYFLSQRLYSISYIVLHVALCVHSESYEEIKTILVTLYTANILEIVIPPRLGARLQLGSWIEMVEFSIVSAHTWHGKAIE